MILDAGGWIPRLFIGTAARERLTFILSVCLGQLKSLLSPVPARWKVYPPTPKFGLRLSEVVNNVRKVSKSSVTTPADPQKHEIEITL